MDISVDILAVGGAATPGKKDEVTSEDMIANVGPEAEAQRRLWPEHSAPMEPPRSRLRAEATSDIQKHPLTKYSTQPI